MASVELCTRHRPCRVLMMANISFSGRASSWPSNHSSRRERTGWSTIPMDGRCAPPTAAWWRNTSTPSWLPKDGHWCSPPPDPERLRSYSLSGVEAWPRRRPGNRTAVGSDHRGSVPRHGLIPSGVGASPNRRTHYCICPAISFHGFRCGPRPRRRPSGGIHRHPSLAFGSPDHVVHDWRTLPTSPLPDSPRWTRISRTARHGSRPPGAQAIRDHPPARRMPDEAGQCSGSGDSRPR